MRQFIMPYKNMIKILPRLLLLTIVIIITSGCSNDGDCNDATKTLVYICVDAASNSYSGFYDKDTVNVDNAIVLIYNKDAQLRRMVKLSREEIENRTPIEISTNDGNHPLIVVWGNLNGSENISNIMSGLQSARIDMQQEGGYTVSTDNLYYGFKELADESEQEVVITTWVGHVYITARGIDDISSNAGNYYFTIESNCNSYDFYGHPQAGKALLKIDAKAEIYHQEIVLVHQPVNLVACPEISGIKQSLNVKLYKKTSAGDTLIASTNSDADGDWIVTRSGENTNVLLDFTSTDNLNVYFLLTPWEYIYQWSWW